MNPTRRIMLAGMKGMILLLVLALASCAPAPVPATRTSPEIPQATKQQVLVTYGKLPLIFEANQGQTDPQVKFLSRGSGYTLFLTPTEAVLTLTKADAQAKRRFSGETSLAEPEKQAATVLRMKFLDANLAPRVTGVEELRGRSNYFIGNDPAKWRTHIPTYAKVLYHHDQVGVWVAAYDTNKPLVIDPTLAYSTYLGGDSLDEGFGIAVDGAGNAYVTGLTASLNFPSTVGFPPNFLLVALDAFVTKLDPTGAALVYSTYLGGTVGEEGSGIAVDTAGNAYVTGQTNSPDFPTTPGAFQPAQASAR